MTHKQARHAHGPAHGPAEPRSRVGQSRVASNRMCLWKSCGTPETPFAPTAKLRWPQQPMSLTRISHPQPCSPHVQVLQVQCTPPPEKGSAKVRQRNARMPLVASIHHAHLCLCCHWANRMYMRCCRSQRCRRVSLRPLARAHSDSPPCARQGPERLTTSCDRKKRSDAQPMTCDRTTWSA
jgi:hypothetical protein